MADKKLSSVSAVSDMNYVYAETSSGETVKISKADLASVVAGLIGFNLSQLFIPRTGLSTNSNLDNVTTVGMYRISGGATNSPVTNGFLLVFFQNSTCLQFCVSSTASELYMRIKWTTSWFDWVKVIG